MIDPNFLTNFLAVKSLTIDVTIRSFAVSIEISSTLRNEAGRTVDCFCSIPVDDEFLLSTFNVEHNQRTVEIQLKKNENQIFAELGPIVCSTDYRVNVNYLTELDLIDKSIVRLNIPKTIFPQFFDGKIRKFHFEPFPVDFRCRIENLRLEFRRSSHKIEKRSDFFKFRQENFFFERDIFLEFSLGEFRRKTSIVRESNGIMFALTPFNDEFLLQQNQNDGSELIFLLDCSSSMQKQNRIDFLRRTMLVFLQNLPRNLFFNVIVFGSISSRLFSEVTVPVDSKNLQMAQKFLNLLDADLSSTDLVKRNRNFEFFSHTDDEKDTLDFGHSDLV